MTTTPALSPAPLALFDQDAPAAPPTLQSCIEAGDTRAALLFLESLPIAQAVATALRCGFTVTGGKRDKQSFYAFLGPQLLTACKARALPAKARFTWNP